MAQLRANDFVYDGKKLSDFGFQVVETDTGNTTQVVGANRTLTTTNTLGGENLITEIKQTNGSFEIKICKMNKYQEVQPITPHDMDRLNLWLFNPKNYRPLMPLVDGEQGEIVYYALFTSANTVITLTISKMKYAMMEYLIKYIARKIIRPICKKNEIPTVTPLIIP